MAFNLFLDDDWDLKINIDGLISTTQGNYCIAQNVANAFRLFTNDAWYDSEKGIPHFAIELKKAPALAVLKSRLKEAALNVDGVKNKSKQDGFIFNNNAEHSEFVDTMNELWSNFARTSVPSSSMVLEWKPYTQDDGYIMISDDSSYLTKEHDKLLMVL